MNRAVVYFPITFTGKNSMSVRNKLNKLMREFYPQLLVRVIFRPKYTIQNFFKFKDSIPLELQSCVVYKYQCHSCSAIYIGKTKRQLRVRIFEHLGRSVRTNRQIAKPPFSAIRDHSHDADHALRRDSLISFTVLASRSHDMELNVTESLLTARDKPTIGLNDRSTELLCF